MRPLLILILTAFLSAQGYAQDLHYSQFYLNPVHFNPAATGMFKGNIRLNGAYRNQWASVPVDYTTYGVGADAKVLEQNSNTLNGGLLVQKDRAGDGGLSWTQIGLNVGAAHQLSETQAIALAFGCAFVQRSVDLGNLRFNNQWDGEVFDPNRPNKETLNQSSGMRPSLSAGVLWYAGSTTKRNRISAGAGAFHLNSPVIGFDPNSDYKIPLRVTFSLNGALQLNEGTDIVAFGLGQQMTTAREIIFGAGVRKWLANLPGNETAIQLTLSHRWKDALIPAIQLDRNNWTVGVSYDWNTSAFDVATQGKGGPEIMVVYRNVPVPAVKSNKSCPMF